MRYAGLSQFLCSAFAYSLDGARRLWTRSHAQLHLLADLLDQVCTGYPSKDLQLTTTSRELPLEAALE